jgi:hypothetical protein
METRVYGIDLNKIDLTHGLDEISNEDFIILAEHCGYVWTLIGFQNDFNNQYINDDNFFIRII